MILLILLMYFVVVVIIIIYSTLKFVKMLHQMLYPVVILYISPCGKEFHHNLNFYSIFEVHDDYLIEKFKFGIC